MCTVTGVGDEVMARSVAGSSADWWRRTRTLATILTWVLAAQAVGQFALVFLDSATPYVRMHAAFDALLDGRDATARRLFEHVSDGTNQSTTQLLNYLLLASTVLLIVWSWRSAHNARALGRVGARLSPGWTIAAWLIPVASFVLPYLVISDLWRSSAPDAPRGDGWRALPAGVLVVAWWVAFAGAQLATAAAIGLAVTGTTNRSDTDVLLVVAHVFAVVSALLTIQVVRTITERQEAQHVAEPAPTSRPHDRQGVVPTTGDGPGWYADPGRRYDHRYWDGTAWTEHVSTAGEASIAPVIPPDWYPDPTGRFHWRYWTGHEWTEHVSRDQELFVDRLAAGEAT
ncbi:MAG: hypothetical protein QOF40_1593 [Actinomycetota bacterium]|nr:hypothetical protein [Actinomycetota bacterium]